MSETARERPDRAIFITGAFNPSLDIFRPSAFGLKRAVISPVGAAHFQRLGKALLEHDIPSQRPIVLKNMGMQHPERTRDQVQEQVQKRLRRHEDERVLLIGHSLGGVMLTHLLAEEAFDDQVMGGVTLGSPHDGVNDEFFRPLHGLARATGRLPGVPFNLAALQDNLGTFAEEGARGVQPRVAAGEISLDFIGSIDDVIVPVNSALSGRAGASRHLVGRYATGLAHDIRYHNTGTRVGHVQLLTNQSVAEYSADTVVGTKDRKDTV